MHDGNPEIQGKLILVRVSTRFELSGVDCNNNNNNNNNDDDDDDYKGLNYEALLGGGGGGRYVPSLNFKTCCFTHMGVFRRKPCCS